MAYTKIDKFWIGSKHCFVIANRENIKCDIGKIIKCRLKENEKAVSMPSSLWEFTGDRTLLSSGDIDTVFNWVSDVWGGNVGVEIKHYNLYRNSQLIATLER